MSNEKGRNIVEVKLDVSSFQADDLSVNVRGRELIVSGHHNEREEGGGIVERRFVRKYFLPKNAMDEVASDLGADGILKITMSVSEPTDYREIPIKVDSKWKMHSNPCQELILRQPIPLWWW